MAASVCRHEGTNVEVLPGFAWQQVRIEWTIHATSSPSRVLRRGGARPATRGDRASRQRGYGLPIGSRFREPMLQVVAPCRRPGRRRTGRRDIVVPDGSVGVIAPSLLTIADRESKSPESGDPTL
jgi:hypothetical protein